MNTPKLISILTRSVGHAEQARVGKAADPAHGLDFSKLLGERRTQAEPADTSRPSPSESLGSSFERKGTPERTTAQRSSNESPARSAQNENRSAARSTEAATQRNNVPAQRDTASASNAADAQSQQGNTARSTAHTSSNPSPAGETSGNGTEVAHGNDAAVPATDIQADAQLAQNAAEAGLAGVVVGQMLNTAASVAAVEGAAAGAPAQTLPHGLPTQAGAASAALPTAAALDADPDLDLAALANARPATVVMPANATASTAAAPGDAALPVTPAQLLAAQPAKAPEHLAGLAAPTLPVADEAPVQLNPIAAALPVATAGTAASRSLQEFTAMVAAARATSGTSLPAGASAAPVVPQPTLPGMMPVGSFAATQTLSQTIGGNTGIAAPLNSPQWSSEFGRQFIRIAQAGNGLGQIAELRLDPPELGPLRITINLSDNVAHAVFSSPHASVRQTVENALPQLQQMLEQAGLSLGQANVNDQGGSEQGYPGEGRQTARHGGTGGADTAGAQAGQDARPTGRTADPDALVDTFA